MNITIEGWSWNSIIPDTNFNERTLYIYTFWEGINLNIFTFATISTQNRCSVHIFPHLFCIGIHVLSMLFVFLYAYWWLTRYPYHMMCDWFNSSTTSVTSEAGTAKLSGCYWDSCFFLSMLYLVDICLFLFFVLLYCMCRSVIDGFSYITSVIPVPSTCSVFYCSNRRQQLPFSRQDI